MIYLTSSNESALNERRDDHMNKFAKKVLKAGFKAVTSIESKFDRYYLRENDVSPPSLVTHTNWRKHLISVGNEPGKRILEIGSREVCGPSSARRDFEQAQYVGFDYYPGSNVDVVGDAHKLSSYFEKDAKFDIIYTSACFEHFAMPWIVAIEIAKLLKVGGLLFVETHFSFSSHERPWNFFQFSDMGLRALFPRALGFECIDSGMSNPIIGRFSSLAADYLKNTPVKNLYCHSEYFGKKVADVADFNWAAVDLADVTCETRYPAPKT
jgi:ubiquinone/menaquinone biosynthesis C-methylase UbiE